MRQSNEAIGLQIIDTRQASPGGNRQAGIGLLAMLFVFNLEQQNKKMYFV